MSKIRISFEKTGRAKYISHLDLVRTMPRAFIRAGIDIRHTEGFNPHPKITFALPLSVGAESVCELMDFEPESEISVTEVPERLNAVLPEGIKVNCAYLPERKFSEIAWLKIEGYLAYENANAESAAEAIEKIFSGDKLIIEKKTKKGKADVDILPLLREMSFSPIDRKTIMIYTLIHAQEPALNPTAVFEAVKKYSPEFLPEVFKYKRLAVLDGGFEIFR